jgi:CRP-like cAMP-binding protein
MESPINEALDNQDTVKQEESIDDNSRVRNEPFKDKVLPNPSNMLMSTPDVESILQRHNTVARRKAQFKSSIPTVLQIMEEERNDFGSAQKSSWLINLDGIFKQTWETINILCLVITFIYVPIRLSFLFEKAVPTTVSVIDRLIDFFFFVDLILNFFTPTIVGVEMAYKHKRIAVEYLKTWFLVDLISIVPFDEVALNLVPDQDDPSDRTKAHLERFAHLAKAMRILRLFKFLRAFRLRKQSKNFFKEIFKWIFGESFILDFMNSLASIVIIVHIAACFWYFVGNIQSGNRNWLSLGHFNDEPLMDKYVVSVYFAIQTFTTVGYGDIPSVTTPEIFMRIVLMFVGTIVYSIFTGEIMDYQAKQMNRAEIIADKLEKLEKLNHMFDLPSTLLNKVKDGIEKSALEDEFEIKASSLDLNRQDIKEEDKNKLAYYIYKSRFSKVKLFKDIDPGMIIKLGESVRLRSFGKEETVYSFNDPAASFYILLSGKVNFYNPDLGDELPFYQVKNGYFGEFEIIQDMESEKGHKSNRDVSEHQSNKICSREYTAKAATDCKIIIVNNEMFKYFLLENEDKVFAQGFIAKALIRRESITFAMNKGRENMAVFLEQKKRKAHTIGKHHSLSKYQSLRENKTLDFVVNVFKSRVSEFQSVHSKIEIISEPHHEKVISSFSNYSKPNPLSEDSNDITPPTSGQKSNMLQTSTFPDPALVTTVKVSPISPPNKPNVRFRPRPPIKKPNQKKKAMVPPQAK